jgi:hypothetical protein
MAAGLAIMIYVRFATPIAFTWYVLIGTVTTFAVGLLASLIFDQRPNCSPYSVKLRN